jgi:type IV secretory pathway TraG/TraD family ATPase VirD4
LIKEADGDPQLAFDLLWEAMLACQIYNGYVSATGAEMIDLDERTRSNVLATAKSKTAFWDHEQIRSISVDNDINLCGFKDPDCNQLLSLTVPVGELKTTLKPWAGVITSLSLAVMEYIPGDLKVKTRFVLEEVQALGSAALHGISGQMALLPGMGAQITIVAHTISGLKAEFPKDWETMIGTAQQVIFMASNDEATIGFIERMALGSKTVKQKKWGIPFLWTVRRFEKQIMDGDQIRRLLEAGRENAIVLRNGRRTIIAKNALSYKVLPVWMINPNRDHKEQPARAWFRKVWEDFKARRAERPEPITDFPLPLTGTAKLEALARSVTASRTPET